MSSLPKPCLSCAAPTGGDHLRRGEPWRCPGCTTTERARREAARPSAARRGYGRRWRETSAAARRASPACEVCGTADDLTTDHVVPLAAGGDRLPGRAGVRVLCRAHNSSRGSRVDGEPGMLPVTPRPRCVCPGDCLCPYTS